MFCLNIVWSSWARPGICSHHENVLATFICFWTCISMTESGNRSTKHENAVFKHKQHNKQLLVVWRQGQCATESIYELWVHRQINKASTSAKPLHSCWIIKDLAIIMINSLGKHLTFVYVSSIRASSLKWFVLIRQSIYWMDPIHYPDARLQNIYSLSE